MPCGRPSRLRRQLQLPLDALGRPQDLLAVGMGKALAENFASARRVFDEVDAALGQKLSLLMWEGPEGDLTLTENAQPALMAVSMAVIKSAPV